jgi:hypothetical protein
MTLHPVTGPSNPVDPPSGQRGQSPVSRAIQAIGTLLSESPLANEQFQEARHDKAEADRLANEAAQSGVRKADAVARAAAERRKADPHERINRPFGTGLAIVFAVLDALPAYWSAEAFGLSQDSTLVLTALLCAALGGGMWLLDLFGRQRRRAALRLLEGALAAGFIGMFVLRFDYLQVTVGDDAGSSAIEALALTTISAALVAVGYVVLSHRTPKAVADAERAVQQTAQSGAQEAAAAARAHAARSRAALEDTVVTWILSHQPADADYEQFLEATGQAIDILLSR